VTTAISPVVNYRALKSSLRELPGFPALKAVVSDYVNERGPKADPMLDAFQGTPALRDILTVFVAARRAAAKVEAWTVVANVLAADVVPAGLPDALVKAAMEFSAMAGEPAVAAGLAAVSAADDALVASLPAINDEAF